MGAVTGIVDGFRARSGELTFLDRLDDFRGRLIASVVVLIVTTVLGFFVAAWPITFEITRRVVDLGRFGSFAFGGWTINLDLLAIATVPVEPYLGGERLKYLSPTDPFFITLKLALSLGFLLALPFLMYQVWRLIAPLLRPDERRITGPALCAGVLLFIGGATFCYFFALPLMLQFTMGFQSASLEQNIVIGEYLKLILRMLIAFGLAFELPIIILLMTMLGLVTPDFLAAKRRHAIAIATVVSAIVTPPDLTSLILLLIPVVLLYEVGILLARAIVARREPLAVGGEA